MTDWSDGRHLYRYDLETGAYGGRLHLRPVPQWQQGITYFGGHLFITADDGDADEGEIEGLAFDVDAGELLVLSNRGRRIVLGMSTGPYPGCDREIHEVYVYSLPGS